MAPWPYLPNLKVQHRLYVTGSQLHEEAGSCESVHAIARVYTTPLPTTSYANKIHGTHQHGMCTRHGYSIRTCCCRWSTHQRLHFLLHGEATHAYAMIDVTATDGSASLRSVHTCDLFRRWPSAHGVLKTKQRSIETFSVVAHHFHETRIACVPHGCP